MIIRSRAPLRLGLAGGGTDVSPYSDRYGGAILNATIDLYAYTVIEPSDDGVVRFSAVDIGESVECSEGSSLTDAKPSLVLHQAVYHRIVREFNAGRPLSCRVTTFCDAPPGSGLGTSSTMVVSLIKGFAEWLNLPLGEYDIARIAYEVERIEAGMKGGRQDQYAATFGGVNFMEFYSDERVVVNPLRIKNWIMAELESSTVLFNLGVSRSSSAIIEEQTLNIQSGNQISISAMHKLKVDAIGMKEALLKGDFNAYGSYMRESWQAKKTVARNVTTERIDRIYDAAMESGAIAGKVSGAGGGGFMTFLVDPIRRADVIRRLDQENGRVVPCHFSRTGTHGWRIL